MKIMVQFILVLTTLLVLGSCNNAEVNNGIEFYWNQTKCSDPWKTGEGDSNGKTRAAIKAYLKEQGIGAVDITGFENTLEDGVVSCESCGCITGIRIYVDVPDSEEAKMLELGFTKN